MKLVQGGNRRFQGPLHADFLAWFDLPAIGAAL
jgi:hypothetical protein